jgi:triphosphoribosyl-dephospho-CoA synthase
MVASRQALGRELRHGARQRAAVLAARAERALILEALLTPKPALVDRRGPGAHRDLDLARLLRSARALRGSFERMALAAGDAAVDVPLRERLGWLGRRAERLMLSATGGSNAHRGAIWVLGLWVAARALCGEHASLAQLSATAAHLAQLPDRHAPRGDSNGSRACRAYGVGGARGEAAAGFPHVTAIGLPVLRAARLRGVGETCAQLDALMAIMVSLDDTCLLHRGGWPAVEAARRGAGAVLAAGGSSAAAGRAALLELDADLKRRNASPGGCADLLAACLFIDGGQHSSCEAGPAWNA